MQLPVLNNSSFRPSPRQGPERGAIPARLVHVLRLLLLLLLLLGLNRLSSASRRAAPPRDLSITDVQAALPEAASIVARDDNSSMWDVLDKDKQTIATAMMSSPQADEVIGYAGPNNVLLLLNSEGRVAKVSLLGSSDTVDHVSKVRESPGFWQQFVGRSMGEGQTQSVDGVSGATLTSLAIAEAIDLRLRGQRSSLRFPEELTVEEVQAVWPGTTELKPDPERVGFARAFDEAGKPLGFVLRTGPLESGVVGYQGPTEAIIALDDHDVIQKVRLRKSFDNEPYVRYTRMEASFWAKFVGRSLSEISQLDIEVEGIEGVSGATMTSMAMVETLKRVATKHLKAMANKQEASSNPSWLTEIDRWNWSWGELTTLLLAILVVPWSWSSLRGNRSWRRVWQGFALIVIVVLSGNLLSMALFAGWTNALPRLSLAPGLVALVVVAIACPALFGRNVYCDHICPHGIAQQWIARRPKWLLPISRKPVNQSDRETMATVAKGKSAYAQLWRSMGHRALHASAVVVMMLAVTWIIWKRPTQLTVWEPFDVYAWRVGLSSSLLVWILSLLLAVKEPMGYCRLACPTGKLLDGIRWKRTGGRVGLGDMLLGLMTIAVWWLG